jgi:SSS family solute:Na+ symporter
MVLLGSFASLARRQSKEHHYISLPDFLHDRFGRLAGHISSLLTVLAFFALLVLQLFAGALVVSEITGFPPWIGVFLSASVVTLYLLFAGFGGVIITDKIQFILMLVGLPTLALVSLPSPADVVKVFDLQFGLIPTIAVLLTGILVVIGSGDIWQRLYAAKSTKAARVGMMSAGIGFAIYGFILAAVGIAARETGVTQDPDSAFLAVVLMGQHGALTSLIVLAVFSAILSTADTEVFLISTLIVNERRRMQSAIEPRTSEPKRAAIRALIPLIALIGAVAALSAESLVSIYEILLYALLALSPLIIIGSFRHLSSSNAAITLMLGTGSLILIASVPQLSLSYAVLVVVPGLLWAIVTSKPDTSGDNVC